MAKAKTTASKKTTGKAATTKKTPQKAAKSKTTVKTSTKTVPKKPTIIETKTRKELTALINQINEEGLLFLKQQASVLIHNQAVEEQKEERRKEQEKKEKAAAKSGGKASKKSSKSTVISDSKPNIGITIEPGPDMRVFYIVTDMTRGFFNKTEFKTIVKVCQSAKGRTAATKNLYTWLRKERGDFLQDAQIETLTDIRMGLIVDAILKDYKI